MAKQEPIELEAEVTQALPNAMFRLKLDSGHEVIGHISGKVRKNFIKIVPGDRVKVHMTPYDTSKARIVYRQKGPTV